jgi:hypothetical protein
MSQEAATFVDKTTTVKTAEPLHLKLERFSKVSKIGITLNVDPNNPMVLDSLLLGVSDSNTKFAVEAFKTLCVEQLGAKLVDDDGNPITVLSAKDLANLRKSRLAE